MVEFEKAMSKIDLEAALPQVNSALLYKLDTVEVLLADTEIC